MSFTFLYFSLQPNRNFRLSDSNLTILMAWQKIQFWLKNLGNVKFGAFFNSDYVSHLFLENLCMSNCVA